MWLLLFIFSLMPAWKRAGIDRPLNMWQYMGAALHTPMKHITVEEALERAEASGYLKRPDNIAAGS